MTSRDVLAGMIFVEPSVAVRGGVQNISYLGVDGKIANAPAYFGGTHFGGRGGMTLFDFSFGFGMRQGSYRLEIRKPRGLVENQITQGLETVVDYDYVETFLFVRYKSPPHHYWINYIYSAEATQTNGLSDNHGLGDVYSGNGVGVGMGYMSSWWLALNIEYSYVNLDAFTDAVSKFQVKDDSLRREVHTVVLSLSLPLELF